MSDPLILKRCMAALQAKYILTDDEAKGMASIVLSVAAALWHDPPRNHGTPAPREVGSDDPLRSEEEATR